MVFKKKNLCQGQKSSYLAFIQMYLMLWLAASILETYLGLFHTCEIVTFMHPPIKSLAKDNPEITRTVSQSITQIN